MPKRQNVHDPARAIGLPDTDESTYSLTEAVRRLKEQVMSLSGAQGDPLDRAATFRELVNLGLVTARQAGGDYTASRFITDFTVDWDDVEDPNGTKPDDNATSNELFTGFGSPSSGLGVDGDLYYQINQGFWVKNGGSWEEVSDITAANIAAGFNGEGVLARLDFVNATTIEPLSITSPLIKSNEIETRHIVTSGLQADAIATGAIIAEKINVETLAAIKSDLGTITAGNIDALTLNADRILAGSLDADYISIDGVTLDTSASELIVRDNGVSTPKITTNAATLHNSTDDWNWDHQTGNTTAYEFVRQVGLNIPSGLTKADSPVLVTVIFNSHGGIGNTSKVSYRIQRAATSGDTGGAIVFGPTQPFYLQPIGSITGLGSISCCLQFLDTGYILNTVNYWKIYAAKVAGIDTAPGIRNGSITVSIYKR